MTTTDQIMQYATLSTIDGMKRCIDALEAHARELEDRLNQARLEIAQVWKRAESEAKKKTP